MAEQIDMDRLPSQPTDLECQCVTPEATCQAPEHNTLANTVRPPNDGACKRFFSFFGITWLVSCAYIDPGSIQGDLSQGAYTGYCLLWVTFWSTVIGYIFQTLAARIGVVSGADLATNIRITYTNKDVHYIIWIFMELAVIGCDIQAVVGSAFALNILFGLAFWAGCLITTAGCLLITVLYHFRGKLVEAITGGCVTVLVLCYIIQASMSAAPVDAVLVGLALPTSPAYAELIAIGTVGALIMPNAIYLHSNLVLTRPIDRTNILAVTEANKYNALVNGIGMVMSFIANVCIVCVFAKFFAPECAVQGLAMVGHVCANIGLDGVGNTFTLVWGSASKYVFATGLYLSGIASGISSTLGSQVIMEGLTQVKMSFSKRVVLTRTITLIPTLTLCLVYGTDATTLGILNEWINITTSFFLPFAIVPVVQVASNTQLMGIFTMRKWQSISLWCITATIMGINTYLIIGFVYLPGAMGSVGSFPDAPAFYTCVGAALVIYLRCCYILVRG